MTDAEKLALAKALDAAGLPEVAWETDPLVIALDRVPKDFSNATTLLDAVEAWRTREPRADRGWQIHMRETVQTASVWAEGHMWTEHGQPWEKGLTKAFLAALTAKGAPV